MVAFLSVKDKILNFHRTSESHAGAESKLSGLVVVSSSLASIKSGIVAVVQVVHVHNSMLSVRSLFINYN